MQSADMTAIILAKNASEALPRCLSSLSWCAHIIVGDDGSTDETIAIAKTHHADVIKLRPTSSFAAKRNELLSYAPTDWVLFVDTDEVVSPALRAAIENGQWTMDNEIDGFYVKRMDVFLGKKLLHGETAHTWLLRLVNKNSGRWVRSVHEVWQTDGKTGTLDGELLHYSHPDLEEFFGKINHYSDLDAEERIKNQESRIKADVFPPYFLLLTSYFQLFVYPVAKFIQNYFFRAGFLDGFQGFVMAYMMSMHSLCVRIKMLERIR